MYILYSPGDGLLICNVEDFTLCWNESNFLPWTWVSQWLTSWHLFLALTNTNWLPCLSFCFLSPFVWALTAWFIISWIVRWVFCLAVFIFHLLFFLFKLMPRVLPYHEGLAWSSPIWNKNIPLEARLSLLLNLWKLQSKQINRSSKQHFPQALL